MRRKLLTTLLGGATVAATAGLVGGPAQAADAQWNLSRTGSFTGTNVGSTVLRNPRTSAQISCSSSTATGNIPALVDADGLQVASITSLAFTGCTGLGNINFSVSTSASAGTPMYLNASSYNASTGVTNGNVSNIGATLTGPGCTVNVQGPAPGTNNGTANGTFTNSTSRLNMTGSGTLTVRSVTGCFGLMAVGDAVTFTGLYQVSPAVQITYTP